MTDELVELGIPGIGPATEVGRGGFGVVYKAKQRSSSGVVAVKVLSGHLDKSSLLRFEREARALGSLRGHPNICTVFDAGVDASGRPYLVMEYAHRTLAQQIADHGAMSWADVADLGVRLAGALHAAHGQGLLHRDVKPENVLITRYGDVRLADFGLVRFTNETMSRGVTATVSHAAPELLRGVPPSVATDLYALGSTLFVALTGHVAFALSNEAHHASLYRRIEEDPVPVMPGVPEPVADAVRTAMAKDPAGRFASAAAMGDALREAQRTLGVAITPLPVPIDDVEEVVDVTGAGTVKGATPHVKADPTQAVVRGNREPVPADIEQRSDEQGSGQADGRRRLGHRFVVALATVVGLLVIGVVLSLGGGAGDGDADTSTGTTDRDTTNQSSTTRASTTTIPLADARLAGTYETDSSTLVSCSLDTPCNDSIDLYFLTSGRCPGSTCRIELFHTEPATDFYKIGGTYHAVVSGVTASEELSCPDAAGGAVYLPTTYELELIPQAVHDPRNTGPIVSNLEGSVVITTEASGECVAAEIVYQISMTAETL